MTKQEFFTNALRFTRAQGGGSDRVGGAAARGCHYFNDSRGRSCVLGQQSGQSPDRAFSHVLMGAHNDSVWESNSDAEFFALWEPRMQSIAVKYGLVYTPPVSDGFAAFRAKVLEPVALEAESTLR